MTRKHRVTTFFLALLAVSPVAAAQLAGSATVENLLIAVLVVGGLIAVTYFLLRHGSDVHDQVERVAEADTRTRETVEDAAETTGVLQSLLNKAARGAGRTVGRWRAFLDDLAGEHDSVMNRAAHALGYNVGRLRRRLDDSDVDITGTMPDTVETVSDSVNQVIGDIQEWREAEQQVNEELDELAAELQTGLAEGIGHLISEDQLNDLTETFKDLDMRKRALRPTKKGKIILVRNALIDLVNTFDDVFADVEGEIDTVQELSQHQSEVRERFQQAAQALKDAQEEINDYLLNAHKQHGDRLETWMEEELPDALQEGGGVEHGFDEFIAYLADNRTQQMSFCADELETCQDTVEDLLNQVVTFLQSAEAGGTDELAEDLVDAVNQIEDVEQEIIAVVEAHENEKIAAVQDLQGEMEEEWEEELTESVEAVWRYEEQIEDAAEINAALTDAVSAASAEAASIGGLEQAELEAVQQGWTEIRQHLDAVSGVGRPPSSDEVSAVDESLTALHETLPDFNTLLGEVRRDQEELDLAALREMFNELEDAYNHHYEQVDDVFTQTQMGDKVIRPIQNMLGLEAEREAQVIEHLMERDEDEVERLGENLQQLQELITVGREGIDRAEQTRKQLLDTAAAVQETCSDVREHLAGLVHGFEEVSPKAAERAEEVVEQLEEAEERATAILGTKA